VTPFALIVPSLVLAIRTTFGNVLTEAGDIHSFLTGQNKIQCHPPTPLHSFEVRCAVESSLWATGLRLTSIVTVIAPAAWCCHVPVVGWSRGKLVVLCTLLVVFDLDYKSTYIDDDERERAAD
jgi:hypothetical protein